jgi:hypothetical protein
MNMGKWTSTATGLPGRPITIPPAGDSPAKIGFPGLTAILCRICRTPQAARQSGTRNEEKVESEPFADLRHHRFPVIRDDSQVPDIPKSELFQGGEEKMGIAVADHGPRGPLPRLDQLAAGRQDRNGRALVDRDLPLANGGQHGDMMSGQKSSR